MVLVHPRLRRRGIGRALLDSALSTSRSRGVRCVWTPHPLAGPCTRGSASRRMDFHLVNTPTGGGVPHPDDGMSSWSALTCRRCGDRLDAFGAAAALARCLLRASTAESSRAQIAPGGLRSVACGRPRAIPGRWSRMMRRRYCARGRVLRRCPAGRVFWDSRPQHARNRMPGNTGSSRNVCWFGCPRLERIARRPATPIRTQRSGDRLNPVIPDGGSAAASARRMRYPDRRSRAATAPEGCGVAGMTRGTSQPEDALTEQDVAPGNAAETTMNWVALRERRIALPRQRREPDEQNERGRAGVAFKQGGGGRRASLHPSACVGRVHRHPSIAAITCPGSSACSVSICAKVVWVGSGPGAGTTRTISLVPSMTWKPLRRRSSPGP
jgi:hypothetical protein